MRHRAALLFGLWAQERLSKLSMIRVSETA
jgi:hypothetical protein